MDRIHSVQQATTQFFKISPFGTHNPDKMSFKKVGNYIARVALAVIAVPFFFITIPVIAFKAKQLYQGNPSVEKIKKTVENVGIVPNGFSEEQIQAAKTRLEANVFNNKPYPEIVDILYLNKNTGKKERNAKTVTESLFIQNPTVKRSNIITAFLGYLKGMENNKLAAVLGDIFIAYGNQKCPIIGNEEHLILFKEAFRLILQEASPDKIAEALNDDDFMTGHADDVRNSARSYLMLLFKKRR